MIIQTMIVTGAQFSYVNEQLPWALHELPGFKSSWVPIIVPGRYIHRCEKFQSSSKVSSLLVVTRYSQVVRTSDQSPLKMIFPRSNFHKGKYIVHHWGRCHAGKWQAGRQFSLAQKLLFTNYSLPNYRYYLLTVIATHK